LSASFLLPLACAAEAAPKIAVAAKMAILVLLNIVVSIATSRELNKCVPRLVPPLFLLILSADPLLMFQGACGRQICPPAGT
jgi:hypothetical protein